MIPTLISSEAEISNMFQQKTNCDEYLVRLNQKESICLRMRNINDLISDKKCKQINSIKDLLANSNYLKAVKYLTKTIVFLTIILIGFICLVSCFNFDSIPNTIFLTIVSLFAIVVVYLLSGIFYSICPFLLLGISYLFFLPFKHNYNEKIEKQINLDKAELNECKKQLNDITSKIEEIASYLRADCVIPEPYWVYANELCYFIQVRRANDLTSAINLLEDTFFKLRMENSQLQQIDLLKCNIKQVEEIKEKIRNLRIYTNVTIKST